MAWSRLDYWVIHNLLWKCHLYTPYFLANMEPLWQQRMDHIWHLFCQSWNMKPIGIGIQQVFIHKLLMVQWLIILHMTRNCMYWCKVWKNGNTTSWVRKQSFTLIINHWNTCNLNQSCSNQGISDGWVCFSNTTW